MSGWGKAPLLHLAGETFLYKTSCRSRLSPMPTEVKSITIWSGLDIDWCTDSNQFPKFIHLFVRDGDAPVSPIVECV